MKTISMMILLFLSNICLAQINIEYLNDVSAEFKEKYYSQKRIYNPLQVGNVWQYYISEDKRYATQMIVSDTLISNRRYFLRINLIDTGLPKDSLLLWERYDTLTKSTYTFDIYDYDNDGNKSEEFLVDSLDAGVFSRYQSYKFFFESWGYPVVTALIKDTGWVKVSEDTVLFRTVEYLDVFTTEIIADKYGLICYQTESPLICLTGVIIGGQKYGTIVSVENNDIEFSVPSEFILENNYPNPFNPTTTINYSVPQNKHGNSYFHVRLIVYDPLGREVALLVNEAKPPGNYSVVFNAKGLPSGVYYYSLISGSTIITKSMVLIK